ncbi:MAG: ethanolamine utilization protein EutH, partial [Nocardioidaceae bacterium]
FPMVYAIRTWFDKPLERLGARFGFSKEGAAGVIAGAVNIQAMFRLINGMPPRDKVMCLAFSVCAAYTLGDHLAFIANFQPNLVAPMIAGKLVAGLLAMAIAVPLSLPEARRLAERDRALDEAEIVT